MPPACSAANIPIRLRPATSSRTPSEMFNSLGKVSTFYPAMYVFYVFYREQLRYHTGLFVGKALYSFTFSLLLYVYICVIFKRESKREGENSGASLVYVL